MKCVRFRVAVSAAALGLICGAALAESVQEVQVQATRTVSKKDVGRSPSGVPIVDLSLSYGVNVADLDLSTHSGAKEAERRVNAAAVAACKELGRQYPGATPNDRDCSKEAAAKAMVTVNQLVADAEKSAKHG